MSDDLIATSPHSHTLQKRPKYARYTYAERIRFLDLYKVQKPKSQVDFCEQNCISPKTFSDWIRNDIKIRSLIAGKLLRESQYRILGAGRSTLFGRDVEHMIVQKILQRKQKSMIVGRADVLLIAQKLHQDLKLTNSIATLSLGWVDSFLQRNNLSIRSVTTTHLIPKTANNMLLV